MSLNKKLAKQRVRNWKKFFSKSLRVMTQRCLTPYCNPKYIEESKRKYLDLRAQSGMGQNDLL